MPREVGSASRNADTLVVPLPSRETANSLPDCSLDELSSHALDRQRSFDKAWLGHWLM